MSKQNITSILNPICRGTVSYISYLASCSCSQIYSEYLLYEPILRIAQSKKYSVKAEFPIEKKLTSGENKKIDFLLEKDQTKLAIEVKWAKSKTIDVYNDVNKLLKLSDADGVVLVFGRTKYFKGIKLKYDNTKAYKAASCDAITWNAGKTSYSAQWFKFKEKSGVKI